MHQPEHFVKRALLACGALVLLLSLSAQTQAQAQVSTKANVPPTTASRQAAQIARGEPARWHQENTSMAARLRTIRKEISAGLQENLGVCKSGPATERPACVKEARATSQLDMAGAKSRAAGGQ